MKLLAVYTTVGSRDDARALAELLVERGLAACAQIQQIESFYRWDGVVQNEPEFRILFKTTEARYVAVEAALLERHPYQLPAIHAVAIEAVHGPYGDWVQAEVGITGPG
jgi:periplasmic divalent cation tolerance protein